MVALLLAAAPAGAVVTEVGSTKVGLQARNDSTLSPPGSESEARSQTKAANVVLHGSVGDYAIYWDPKDQFTHEWLVNLDGFFRSLGEASLATPFGVARPIPRPQQRGRAVPCTFKGSYSDT